MEIRSPLLLRCCGSLAAAAVLLAGCAGITPSSDGEGPRPLYAYEASSDFGMVSTGSIEATEAGLRVLERGGNAVDAAVAAAFALGVSDPGGSGLGGATYMLIVPAVGSPVAIDGSSPVPLAADSARLRAMRDAKQYYGHAAVTVPTTPATLAHALERYGTVPLGEVLQPAVDIAERGFRVSSNSVSWAAIYLDEIRASRFFRWTILPDGERLPHPGERLCSPELRETLLRIARDGVDTFYRGTMAAEISADMAANGGFVQAVDLSLVRVRELLPLRSSYRGVEVLSFPLPGGGGEVIAALNILQEFPSSALAVPTVERQHLLVEAARIAHRDHAAHVMATAGAGSPFGSTYLSPQHARDRAALIRPGRAVPEEALGHDGPTPDFGDHTTHVSVMDAAGTAVSLTQTLCRVYGAKVSAPGLGFPYNGCLEFLDLDDPSSPFFLQPRAIYPTAMAPTVLKSDRSVTVLGGAGSDRITSTIIEVTSNLVDRGLGLRDAVVAPRVLWNPAHDPQRICVEIAGPTSEADADRLQSFGFEHMFRYRYPPVENTNLGFFGGVNAVSFDLGTGVFRGVGDPRRDGFAAGPQVVATGSED